MEYALEGKKILDERSRVLREKLILDGKRTVNGKQI